MKNIKNTVSIIIPTFNRAHFLKKVIDSAINQTYECEVIVCNHGSTDDTDKVAKAYKDKIKYIKRDRDFGPHFCWLEGVTYSNGKFIHLQYDDDWIESTFIERCMEIIDKDTGFCFASPKIYNVKENKYSSSDFHNWLPRTGKYLVKDFEKKLIKRLISPSAVVYRRSEVIDGLYQGNLPLSKNHYHGVGPDQFLTLLSMLRYKKFGFVSEQLAIFSAHDDSISISASKDRKSQLNLIKSYREVRQFYKELKFLKTLRYIFGMFQSKYYFKDLIHNILYRRK